MTVDIRDLNCIVREANQKFQSVREEINKVIVGQHSLIESLLIAMLSDGHILLEGLPGLAKTLAVTTLAKVVDCDFKRIQFTPDLLPADLVGTTIYNPKEGTFTVKKGPLFTNLVLADEINRAPAKVQSALLEVMAEKQITIGSETFYTGDPFLVLATQNPVDQEGTYPLPEAQTDRFMMKVKVEYPKREDEKLILTRMSSFLRKPSVNGVIGAEDILQARRIVDDIYVDEKVQEYILDVIFATREPQKSVPEIEGLLEYGASPRASIALMVTAKAHAFLQGRAFVTPHDVKSVGHRVLRHRLRLSYEAEAEEITSDIVIDRIFDKLLVP
ncbi:MAG: MoxR-like ATPase [Chlamydiales bacterium]|jgi:MoxR-like ATPase